MDMMDDMALNQFGMAAAWRGIVRCALGVVILGSAAARGQTTQPGAEIPVSGPDVAELKSFDEMMLDFLARTKIPGAALAVAKDERLIFARGYGYANVEAKTPVEPTSLFRIASVTKPFTSTAIFTLLQDPKYGLSLDTPVFKYLDVKPADGAKVDERIWRITIRDCLQHSGGWDRGTAFDPMGRNRWIAELMEIPPPARQKDIIRFMMGCPLQFDPGTRMAYSNFGYCVLGRVIEKSTGKAYDEYVREKVLGPMGIRHMRLGKPRRKDCAPDEVFYYDAEQRRELSAWGEDCMVPLEENVQVDVMDSHGGWIASAPDLLRFAIGFQKPGGKGVLTAESLEAMLARPPAPLGREKDGSESAAYYACGWQVRPIGKSGRNVWHNGGLPGTMTLLVSLHNGMKWAVLFNGTPAEGSKGDLNIDGLLHQAAGKVKTWPEGDLFGRY